MIGKDCSTKPKFFRPESSLSQRMTEMETKILASIDAIKTEMNGIKTEQNEVKKRLDAIEQVLTFLLIKKAQKN